MLLSLFWYSFVVSARSSVGVSSSLDQSDRIPPSFHTFIELIRYS